MTPGLEMDGFTHLASLLPGAMRALQTELAAVESRLHTLQTLGLQHARPEWRKGRLTLVFPPDVNGKHPRRYIGREPGRVAAALAAIERAQEYDQLVQRMQRLQMASCVAFCDLHHVFLTLLAREAP